MRRAQGAIEVLVIAGIALVVIGALFFSLNRNNSSSQGVQDKFDSRRTLEDLSMAGESLMQQGIGAKSQVVLSLPQDVSSITFSGRQARLIFSDGSSSDQSLPYNAQGALINTADGLLTVDVTSTAQGVCFGELSACVTCGDGLLDAFEQCDDGNTNNGDGCSANCVREVFCGDGITSQPTETCDDGNTVSNDGCSATCQSEATCGDNQINQANETCDDGNMNNGDGCTSKCLLEIFAPTCGDGSLNQANETCDDGNLVSGDGCYANCTVQLAPPVCGDGSRNQISEECDDGNLDNYDGCSALCKIENDTSSITSCIVITDTRGNITVASNRPNITISINNSLPGHTTGGTPTATLPNTTFTTPITLNADVLGNDSILDAACNTYYGLLNGNYYYSNVIVSGGSWQKELYNDQYTQPAFNTSFFYPYDYSVFDFDPSNDGPRNRNADGMIVLVTARSRRTVIALMRYPYACGDGVVQGNETCDDSNTIGGDGCSTTCLLEYCGNGIKDANETCDGTDFGDVSCANYGIAYGSPTCEANCSAITSTSCHNVPGKCVYVNVTGEYLQNSKKRLRGVYLKNTCPQTVHISGGNVSIASSSRKLTQFNISTTVGWTSTCAWGCVPVGQQNSNVRVYFKQGNLTTYNLTAGEEREVNRFEFSSSVSGVTLRVGITLNDSSRNYSSSFTP